jgi:hypothetical protein
MKRTSEPIWFAWRVWPGNGQREGLAGRRRITNSTPTMAPTAANNRSMTPTAGNNRLWDLRRTRAKRASTDYFGGEIVDVGGNVSTAILVGVYVPASLATRCGEDGAAAARRGGAAGVRGGGLGCAWVKAWWDVKKKKADGWDISEEIEWLKGRDASGLDGKEKRVAGAEADTRGRRTKSQSTYEVWRQTSFFK